MAKYKTWITVNVLCVINYSKSSEHRWLYKSYWIGGPQWSLGISHVGTTLSCIDWSGCQMWTTFEAYLVQLPNVSKTFSKYFIVFRKNNVFSLYMFHTVMQVKKGSSSRYWEFGKNQAYNNEVSPGNVRWYYPWNPAKGMFCNSNKISFYLERTNHFSLELFLSSFVKLQTVEEISLQGFGSSSLTVASETVKNLDIQVSTHVIEIWFNKLHEFKFNNKNIVDIMMDLINLRRNWEIFQSCLLKHLN